MKYVEPTQGELDKATILGYEIIEDYNGKPMFVRDICVVKWHSLDGSWASHYVWEQSNGGEFIACKHYYACLAHALERKDITDQTNRATMTGNPYKSR